MTCAGCSRPFTKQGIAAQSLSSPRLCLDCSYREVAFHGYHAPGTKCIQEFLGIKKEATHGRAS